MPFDFVSQRQALRYPHENRLNYGTLYFRLESQQFQQSQTRHLVGILKRVEAEAQFEISDKRSVDTIIAALKENGLDAVFKDWQQPLHPHNACYAPDQMTK